MVNWTCCVVPFLFILKGNAFTRLVLLSITMLRAEKHGVHGYLSACKFLMCVHIHALLVKELNYKIQ